MFRVRDNLMSPVTAPCHRLHVRKRLAMASQDSQKNHTRTNGCLVFGGDQGTVARMLRGRLRLQAMAVK